MIHAYLKPFRLWPVTPLCSTMSKAAATSWPRTPFGHTDRTRHVAKWAPRLHKCPDAGHRRIWIWLSDDSLIVWYYPIQSCPVYVRTCKGTWRTPPLDQPSRASRNACLPHHHEPWASCSWPRCNTKSSRSSGLQPFDVFDWLRHATACYGYVLFSIIIIFGISFSGYWRGP